MVKHIRWEQVTREQLNPSLARQFINGEKLTLSRITLRKGCIVPEHHHENEQFAWALEGALRFIFPDHEVVLRAGEVLCIPANVPHKVEALEDTVNIDVFAPPRMDWATGEDAYLRK